MEGLDPKGATMQRTVGIRNAIAMKAGGDLAIDALNEIADSEQPLAVMPHIAVIIKRLRDDDDVHEDLVAASLAAAEKATAFAKEKEDSRAAGMMMHFQSNLLFFSGQLDEALALQEKAVENFDDRVTRKFMKTLEEAKAEQEEEAAADEDESEDADEAMDDDDDSAAEDAPADMESEDKENSEEADSE